MKKIKIIMPLVAFVFAIALSFASANTTSIAEEGEFIQLDNPQSCEQVTANCSGSGDFCTIPGQQVYKMRNGTVCSQPLRHTP